MSGTTSSFIWDYFNKEPNNSHALCKLCKKIYSCKTTISNLKKHLKAKHFRAFSRCVDIDSSISNQLHPTTSTKANMDVFSEIEIAAPTTTTDSLVRAQNLSTQTSQKQSVRRVKKKKRPITEYVPRKLDLKDKKAIDDKLVKMIYRDYQPFSIVEDKGFREFVKALNPSYELPNRKLISSTLIPRYYLECRTEIVKLVRQAKKLCLTIDYWTSSEMDAYLAVTAHFILNFELKSVLLHCEHFSGSHTSKAISTTLKNIGEEWQIQNKICLVVSNNVSITNALELTGWPHIGCFLHKLNLVVENALKSVDFVIEIVRKVVCHFKKSNLATEALLKYQTDYEKKTEALRLVQSVPRMWNSVYNMFNRFLQLQIAMQAVMPNIKGDLPKITGAIWDLIKQICMILKPFEEVTRVMDGTQYLTASLALIIVSGLRNVICIMKSKNLLGVAKTMLENLEDNMANYFPKNVVDDNLLLGTCTILDPRFKIHGFLAIAAIRASTDEHCERSRRAGIIRDHVLELIKLKMQDANERKGPMNHFPEFIDVSRPYTSITEGTVPLSIWGEIDETLAAITPSADDISTKANHELEMYLNEDVISRQCCPLKWWESHACIYPNLAEIFTENCHIVVTSVQCERVFSKTGYILSDRRTALSRKRASELVFLNSNYEHLL